VFGTTLSREYALAAAAFRLQPAQLVALAAAGVAHAFAAPHVKAALRAQMGSRAAAAAVAAAVPRTQAGAGLLLRDGRSVRAWAIGGAVVLSAVVAARVWARVTRTGVAAV
jgi:hypothetical protein